MTPHKQYRNKSKTIASFLALFGGIFGAQYFYLGITTSGVFCLVGTLVLWWMGSFIGTIVLGVLDYMTLVQMSGEEFDNRYNFQAPDSFEWIFKPRRQDAPPVDAPPTTRNLFPPTFNNPTSPPLPTPSLTPQKPPLVPPLTNDLFRPKSNNPTPQAPPKIVAPLPQQTPAPTSGNPISANSENRNYRNTWDQIFAAAQKAIRDLGYKGDALDKTNGLVNFKTGMSLKSFNGQEMSIMLIDNGDGSVEVSVTGRQNKRLGLKQMFDWGEAAGIAKNVLVKMDEYLK